MHQLADSERIYIHLAGWSLPVDLFNVRNVLIRKPICSANTPMRFFQTTLPDNWIAH